MQVTREPRARHAAAGEWHVTGAIAALATAAVLAGCAGGMAGSGPSPAVNTKPGFVGAVTRTVYDGAADDLLTGGTGQVGSRRCRCAAARQSRCSDRG